MNVRMNEGKIAFRGFWMLCVYLYCSHENITVFNIPFWNVYLVLPLAVCIPEMHSTCRFVLPVVTRLTNTHDILSGDDVDDTFSLRWQAFYTNTHTDL